MATKKLQNTLSRSRTLLAALSVCAMLVACSGGSGGSNTGDQKPAAAPKGTLNILVSSAPGSDAGFKAVNKAFGAKYPDIKIEFSSIPNNNYPAARASRLSAGSIDVGLAGPQELPSYVPKDNEGDDARLAEAGGLVDLTGMPFVKNYTPTVMDSLKFNDKQYTVPTGLSYYTGVYYNKAIFTKYKIEIPTTWTEFLAVCKTLKDNGVTPLGIGGKDSWPAGLNMLAAVQGLYPSAQDKQDLAKGLWEQKISLTDEKPLEVLKRTSTMYENADKNFAGEAYSAITSGFIRGSFAMTADGTWNQTTIAEAGGSGFEFGYFPLPVGDEAADNTTLGGKVELTLAVPTNSKNVGAALAYLEFFSEPKNYESFVTLAGFAPAQPNITLNPFLTSIEPYTKTFVPAWDTVWVANSKSGPKSIFPFNYPGLSPLGSGTPQEAADAAQKDWAAGF